MTYESEREAQVLKSLWRSGAQLENTLFAILDPEGRPLTQGMRSPNWMFNDAREMAAGLDRVAAEYRSRSNPRSLPVVANVRLGMNVAACDKRPIAIVLGDNEQERKSLEVQLASVAWSGDFLGEMIYASGTSNELGGIAGRRISKGFIFVSPNEFGTAGTVIEQLSPTASIGELASAMKLAINRHQPLQLDHREHIRMGREQGIRWNTALPVTDPHSLEAERMDQQRGFGRFGPPPMRPFED